MNLINSMLEICLYIPLKKTLEIYQIQTWVKFDIICITKVCFKYQEMLTSFQTVTFSIFGSTHG